jgi:hypothetical protein
VEDRVIYEYAVSEMSAAAVGENRLDQEIRSSAITVALRGVSVSGDTLSIEFAIALSVSEEATLDGIVSAHSGVPLPGGGFDAAGNQIVAPTFLHASERARLRGYTMTCAADEVTILDVEVTTQLLVQGAQFWVQGCERGDLAQFAVVDKNDVLGLHTLYGYPIGTPIELTRYVKDYPLPTLATYEQDLTMPTVAPIASGLFLRCIYEAGAGGSTRYVGVVLKWYEAT